MVVRRLSAALTSVVVVALGPWAHAQDRSWPAGEVDATADAGDDDAFWPYLPSVLTTRVVARQQRESAQGSSDTAWLQGLAMPDFPVRLTDPVVEQLEKIREPGSWWHETTARWLKRSGRYEPMIREILREEGVPEDLIFVAMIESSFNAKAVSPAGAAGLWQFMPAAGAGRGLTQDHWVDQRFDPERATRAAAQTLARLHDELGTWELAFAAYNMGYYGLLTSIRTYNTNDYWRLRSYEYALPQETRNYVPRIVAAAIVGRNLERFGYGGLERDPQIEADEVEVRQTMTLARLASVAGASVDVLAQLNPELRRNRTPAGAKSYRLRVPAGAGEKVAAALRKTRGQPEQPKLARHTVAAGEDLQSVASQHGMSGAKLAQLNDMEPREPLEPGAVLLVPAEAPRAASRAAVDGPVTVVVASRQFAYGDRRRVFYRVAEGDSIETVAEDFTVTPVEVMLWNDLDRSALLQPGMVLQLFVSTRSAQALPAGCLSEDDVRVFVAGTTEHYEEVASTQQRSRFTYRVRAGDTIKRIARRYGMSEGLVARINHVSPREELETGRELVLYVTAARERSEERSAPEPPAEPPAEPAAEPAPEIPPPPPTPPESP